MYQRIVRFAAIGTLVVLATSAIAGPLAGESLALGQAGLGQIERWLSDAQATATLSTEPESYTMMLAGAGLMLSVVFRRRKKIRA